MEVKQIYELVNEITGEVTGKTDLLKEDLSNLVDVGEEIFDATSIDNYVHSLVNHIGKVKFVNRVYNGSAPSVYKDGWEFGSVLQKISSELPVAVVNETWKLEHGKSYDENVFIEPKVKSKFYNDKVTFEIDVSVTDIQVKESFSSAEQLNGFLSMLTTQVLNAFTISMDALIMRTINSMTADTIEDGKKSKGIRSVNLLKQYQDETGQTLNDPALAQTDPEFLRFAAYKLKQYESRLSSASELFNIGGNVRFTPKEDLHIVMHNDFKSAVDVYLQSDTYNKEFTALPNAETVPFWQGSGLNYGFDATSTINVQTASGADIEQSGIIAVMFDGEALGVTNEQHRVTSKYNARAEFTNSFYKAEAAYFNDGDENFVAFYVEEVRTEVEG